MPVIVPAIAAFNARGIPRSIEFDDVYHSPQGALGQAEHVFLAGNGIPERWHGQNQFTILETGFGLGINFLATWQAWRTSAAPCERLHYVAVEKHPFTAADMRAMLHAVTAQDANIRELGEQLLTRWPILTPGLHRLIFEQGRITLTLALGEAETLLWQLKLHADAIYLDGFVPRNNPAMWSERVFKGVARLAAPHATVATYSAGAGVRAGLTAAGFTVATSPGYAGKRYMLSGQLTPTRAPDRRLAAPRERHAMVIGAGLAGCAIASSLTARGWRVTLIERHSSFANEASGNAAGTFHPVVSRDDNLLARLTRNAFMHNLRAWDDLARRGYPIQRDACGVLQLPGERRRGAGLPRVADWPDTYVTYLDQEEASARCGVRLKHGGLWFPGAGWLAPASLCAAQLDAAGERVTRIFATEVAHCEYSQGSWRAIDAAGRVIAEAPVLVLANALDAARLMPLLAPALRAVRGQLTYLPADAYPGLKACVCGNGYLLPTVDGRMVAGATYEPDKDDVGTQVSSHTENLARVAHILAEETPPLDPRTLEGRAALRAVTPDRMPLIGALPDASARAHSVERAQRLPYAWCATGFASRGILWGTLAGEIIAAQLDNEPAPIERDLARAIDPVRFLARS